MAVTASTTIADVMTPAPLTVSADCTVQEARRTMQGQALRHLAVTDANGEISLLSEDDIRRVTAPALSLGSDELRVGDICEPRAHVAESTDPLPRVLAAMAAERIDAVLVMREGELTGIFTTTDACRLFAELLDS